MSSEIQQEPEPPQAETKRRLSSGAIAGIIVGGVVLVVVIVAAIVVAITAAAPKSFSDALDECGIIKNSYVSLLDDGDGLLLDGKGEDSSGLALEPMACVLDALDVPDSTVSRMESTRALDGRQSNELENYTIEWTYHPDDGLDILITR